MFAKFETYTSSIVQILEIRIFIIRKDRDWIESSMLKLSLLTKDSNPTIKVSNFSEASEQGV